MWLTATFYDARRVQIETIQGPAAEIIGRISDFVRLHGTDPDGEGAAADSGHVEFSPINAPEA